MTDIQITADSLRPAGISLSLTTQATLAQRLAGAGITGAATLGAMAIGTELYQFTALPEPAFHLDVAKATLPVAAAVLGATNVGMALYRGLGYVTQRVFSHAYPAVQEALGWLRGIPAQDHQFAQEGPSHVSIETQMEENAIAPSRQRRYGLALGAIFLTGAVTAFNRTHPYSTPWQVTPADTFARDVINATNTRQTLDDVHRRFEYNIERLFGEKIVPITEHSAGLLAPPSNKPSMSDLFGDWDKWDQSIASWYSSQESSAKGGWLAWDTVGASSLRSSSAPARAHTGSYNWHNGPFGILIRSQTTGPFSPENMFTFLNGRLVESNLRLQGAGIRHGTLLFPSGIFLLYSVQHAGRGNDRYVVDVQRQVEYGPFTTDSPNPGEVSAIDDMPVGASFERVLGWRRVTDGSGHTRIQTLFRRFYGEPLERRIMEVPLGQPVEPLQIDPPYHGW